MSGDAVPAAASGEPDRSATPESLARHLAAVMFTDLQGYTALMHRDEEAALRARTRHRTAVEAVAARFDGKVLQYFGDGSLSLFPSVVEAARAAVELQRLAREGDPLALRVGLHLGDVAYDPQGAYGDAVNVAARIEALCPAGGVLVTERVAQELRNHPDLPTRRLGRVELKNVREPMELHALAAEGLVTAPLGGPPAGSGGREGPGDGPPEHGGAPRGGGVLSEAGRGHLSEALGRPPYRFPGRVFAGRPPLEGRERELEGLERLLERGEAEQGGTAFLRGGRGVGKSRLAEALAESALGRGWWVAMGRSYPAERRMPFAPFADAFQAALRGLSAADLGALAPGGEDILRHVFPMLGEPAGGLRLRYSEPGELQTRICWHFHTLVSRLAREAPLLFILEDAQWTDPSSVELFHFVARQCGEERTVFLCVHAEADPEQDRLLRGVERSLRSMDRALALELGPLSEGATTRMIEGVLERSGPDVKALAARLHRWTGGNPFFTEGILRGLLESGRVVGGAEGRLEPHDVELELPRSVRDAILDRVARLGPEGRTLVELLAVKGAPTPHQLLATVADLPEDELIDALDELQRYHVVNEIAVGPAVEYDFVHPLIGEAIRSELSLARRRSLHFRIGVRLEERLGTRARERAEELAYHFARAHPGQAGDRAVRYLVAAGRRALTRHANREAAEYLGDALERLDAAGTTASPPEEPVARADDRADVGSDGERERREDVGAIVEGVAKARTRLGENEEAVRLWKRALGLRRSAGDRRGEARIHREIGLMLLWSDHLDDALEELASGVAAARDAADAGLEAIILLAVSLAHQHAGQTAEARRAVGGAMRIAEESGDPGLLARAHGATLRLEMWTGELRDVRVHGEKALRYARECGDPAVAFWSHWAMGVAEGLFGNIHATGPRIEEARRIAEEVGSPILALWTDEFTVEHSYSTGDWDRGLAVGERALRLARDLNQKTVLPRLLVWTALIHIGKGDFPRAKELTDEAWEVSGAVAAEDGRKVLDLHTVVPAHIGRAAYHCALGDWDEAIRVGELGARLAQRSGYVVWGLHRLLPILAEAHIHTRNLDEARAVAAEMRALSQRIGHDLGLAWAGACEALLTWLGGDLREGARQLEEAADRLDAIPMTWEAARLRRQLAGRLSEIGDLEGSREQLDRVLATCRRLGARHELEKVLGMYAEIGADPPERRAPDGG